MGNAPQSSEGFQQSNSGGPGGPGGPGGSMAASSSSSSSSSPSASASAVSSGGDDGNVMPSKEEIANYLKSVPLLAKLSHPDRNLLVGAVVVKTFKPSEPLVKEGQEGHELFILFRGKAVVTCLDDQKHVMELSRLSAGDFFGEASLLSDTKHQATISAAPDVPLLVCLSLARTTFLELMKDKIGAAQPHRAAISAEPQTANQANEKKTTHEPSAKTPEKKNMILGAVRSNMLFRSLSHDQQEQITSRMWLKEVKAGIPVIKQGELGDHFYVVDSGFFEIFVSGVKVAERGPGTSFGELALMYNAPRAATVTATLDSTLWTIDRWTYRRLLTDTTERRLREFERFLKRVQLLVTLSDSERAKIAEAMEEANFPPNHQIVKQGEEGDTFFVLKEGEVVCTVKDAEHPESVEVNRYKAGDYFGERALIKNQPRAATVTTVGHVQVLYLNRNDFSRLLGPLDEIMHRRVETYSSYKSLPGLSPPSSPRGAPMEGHGFPPPLSPTSSGATNQLHKFSLGGEEPHLDKTLKLSDLTVIGTLGKGSFGHVQLVRDPTGKTHALKTVSKAQIVQLGQQEHILSEKRVMAVLDHPFLVRLNATFKDKNFLYFLLEPSLGGELFSVLRAKTFFDEDTARFYAAGVVLAFEYMHSKDIIYRDLKPENLLLDEAGYIKITDFGFAKKVRDRTWTLCGTPDYLAPEVVSGQGHGKGVDWWTLGILIYEMLASYPPFYDEDPMKTYAKIMHGHVSFPMHFSKAAIELVTGLLHPKPTKRLGVIKGGAALIKAHVWFKGFDWDSFLKKKLSAPIRNAIKSQEDLTNFESYPEEDPHYEEYVPDPKNPEWDGEF